MSDTDIHSCGYFCDRYACIVAQRNELRDKLFGERWVKTYSGGKPNYTEPVEPEPMIDGWPLYSGLPPPEPEPLGQHEFIDTTAKWGRDFVEVLNPLEENAILRFYHEPLQQPEPEPVAYINIEERMLEWVKPTRWETPTVVKMDKVPLYTTPPKKEWVGLTDEELEFYTEELGQGELGRGVLRAVVDFLKEKNNA
jgi:hypothetical protein